ncbi:MAG: hypothetical protein J5855_00610 [Mailhella sp.]|nr:hypothetical protein [Mailhella sp.]
MKKILCMGALLLLTGCGLSVHDRMAAGLAALEGAPRNRVFSVLGVPDGRFDIDGRTTAYIWSNRESGTRLIALPNTANGMYGQTPFNVNAMSFHNVNYDHACTVKITMQDDIARMWEYRGNEDACRPYAQRLRVVIPH